MNRCVVIGCGWAGTHHMETIVASPIAQLVAVVESDPDRANIVAKEYNLPAFHSLNDLLCSDVNFEVGVVATLADSHKEYCVALADAGKHILCEKPVCRNSKDIEKIVQAVKKAGVKFGAIFNQRYGEAVQKAKELLTADHTPIHLITGSMYQHFPVQLGGHIREDFIITDSCCHLLDLITFFGGPVYRMNGIAKKINSEAYSDITALLDFESNGIGVMSHTTVGGKLDSQHPFQCIEIHTGNARYKIENHCDRLIVYPHDSMAQTVYETSVFRARDYSVSLRAACNDFLQALEKGGDPPIGIEEALTNMQYLEAITGSINDTR